ncbi:hypothetical protein RYB68_08040 [Pseudomonas syringae pv. actinidiae]|nr:hypothetical protein [Pseudomonas syringae pv. actinidiae]
MKPYYRADKTLAGVMVSLVDITQIRQTDQRAKSLEARLNRITSNLLVGVFEASQVAEQLPVFSYLAGPIEELLGISIEDVLDNSALLFDSHRRFSTAHGAAQAQCDKSDLSARVLSLPVSRP